MNDCLVLCRRVHSLLLLGLLPVVGYFYASLRRFLLLLLLFLFFFFVISSSFVVTNRVFVARRPTCSVHPDAFLFWRRFDLPSPPPPPRISKVSGFEIKKAHPLGWWRAKKRRTDDRWGEIIVAHPSCFREKSAGKTWCKRGWVKKYDSPLPLLVATQLFSRCSFFAPFHRFFFTEKYSLYRAKHIFGTVFAMTRSATMPFGLLGFAIFFLFFFFYKYRVRLGAREVVISYSL